MFQKVQKKVSEHHKRLNSRFAKCSLFKYRGSHPNSSSAIVAKTKEISPPIVNNAESTVFVETPPPDVRLVLFKELGDTSERINIFDSKIYQKVICQPQQRAQSEEGQTAENSSCKGDEQYQACCRAPSDWKILSEMLFGSVGMAQKAPSLKIHDMRNPSQIMISRVFCLPSLKEAPTTGSLDRSSDSHIEMLRDDLVSRRKAKTMPVPTSTDYQNIRSHVASSYSENFHRSDSSNSLSAFFASSYQGLSQSLTGSLGTAPYTRPMPPAHEKAHSLPKHKRESFTLLSENQNGESLSLRRSRMRLGFAVLFQPEPSDIKAFRQFFFDHFPIIESHIMELKMKIEEAFKAIRSHGRQEFIKVLMKATYSLSSKLRAVYCARRLPEPVWITLTLPGTPQKQKALVTEVFIADIARLVAQFNTKQTNFFLSGLLTAALTYHLGWVGFSSSGQQPKQSDPGSYNALWAQLGDLYGAVGNPTKVGRTIVSGSQHETVSTILSVLSYFVQCTLVNDCVPVPEKLTPDVVMAPGLNFQMTSVPCDLKEEEEYVMVSLNASTCATIEQKEKRVSVGPKPPVARCKSSPHGGEAADWDTAPSLARSHSGPMVKKARDRSNAIFGNGRYSRQRTYSGEVHRKQVRSRRTSNEKSDNPSATPAPKPHPPCAKIQPTSDCKLPATDGSFCMRRRVNYLNFPESIEWPEVPTHTPCREPLEGGGVKRARSTSTLSDSGKGSGVRKVQTFTDLIEPRIVNEGLVQRAPVLGPEARLPAPLPNKNKPPVSGHKKTSSVGAIAPGIVTSNERRARKEASPASRSASNPSSTARPVNVSGTNEHPSSPGTKCKVATRRRQLPPCPRKGSQVAGDEDGEGQTSESFQRLKLMRIPSVEMNHNAFDEYFSDDCPLHRSDDVDLTTRSASGHVTGHASWASAGNLTDLANVSRVEHPPVVAKSPPPLPSVGPNNVSKPSQPPLPTRGPVGAVSFNARNDQVAFHPTGLDKHCQNTTSLSETEKSPSPQPVPARVPAASVKESPDDNLEELPLPLLKPAPSNTWAKGEGFASLMADYSQEYLSDFALVGLQNLPNLHNQIMLDLRRRARDPPLDEPVSETICIHADTDSCSVMVYSSHRLHSEKTSLPALTSRLVGNILQQVAQLYQMKISPKFCMEFLEGEMRQLVLKSRMLAEYVKGHKRVTVAQLSAVLGIVSQDLPLLMSIASCHSPHVAKIMI